MGGQASAGATWVDLITSDNVSYVALLRGVSYGVVELHTR